ncbi:uncharacterized protein EV420DRAFT_1648699 [Desarmillaria tabescens]|uniref:Uncharacterized protein n=1 Tax=Armillaria tabescens TaxID=1929756 RepID=A0AA39JKT8_ARMTA|nr:uncharacterized protein EV420DRAFT_1648699 [Desarmillaria tabescens]KAK0444595.1 hypothetical protein EV420DRAFT_1648699 [Desarmillaria tabescens]
MSGDDQLAVRLLSEELVRKCMKIGGSSNLGWSFTLDEKLSPKLNAYAVAAIGYSQLSRWMTLTNLPQDLREEDFIARLIPRAVEFARFDPMQQQAQIGFLNIWQALQVIEVVLSFDQRDEGYLLPDWYPEEDVNQRNVNRAVRISNVTSSDTAHTIRSWIRDFEESGLHHVLFYSRYPKKNLIKMVFSTSVSAQDFVEKYMSAAQGIGAEMLLKPQKKPLPRSKITAVDLGASLPSTAVGISKYQKSLETTSPTAGFLRRSTEGASMNFIGAQHLAPFVKTYERRDA